MSGAHRLAVMVTMVLAALTPAASTGKLSIVPGEGEVRFFMETTWHEVIGVTREVIGTIESAGGDPFTDGLVRVSIDAASLDTGNKRRNETMRGEYLETDRYPTIEFASTGSPAIVSTVTGAGGKYTEVSLELTGDLTIHGETRRIRLPVVVTPEGAAWKVEGQLAVLLSDHAIPDPSLFVNRVKDEVTVSFSVKARIPAE